MNIFRRAWNRITGKSEVSGIFLSSEEVAEINSIVTLAEDIIAGSSEDSSGSCVKYAVEGLERSKRFLDETEEIEGRERFVDAVGRLQRAQRLLDETKERESLVA